MFTAAPPPSPIACPDRLNDRPPTQRAADHDIRHERVMRLRREIFFNTYSIDDKLDTVIDRLADDLR